jgi:hypothetical protein
MENRGLCLHLRMDFASRLLRFVVSEVGRSENVGSRAMNVVDAHFVTEALGTVYGFDCNIECSY